MATRAPRPKRSLYRFAVKRVFDTMLQAFPRITAGRYTDEVFSGEGFYVTANRVSSEKIPTHRHVIHVTEIPGNRVEIYAYTRSLTDPGHTTCCSLDRIDLGAQTGVNQQLLNIFDNFAKHGGGHDAKD